MKRVIFFSLLIAGMLDLSNLIIAVDDLVNNTKEPIEQAIQLIEDPSKISNFDYDFNDQMNRMLSSADLFSEMMWITLKVR